MSRLLKRSTSLLLSMLTRVINASCLPQLTLFYIVNLYLSRYPSCTSDEVLANRFNSFFLEKINTIRSSIIGSSDANISCPPLDASFSKCELL